MPTSPGRPRGSTTSPCLGLAHALERLGLSVTAAAELAGWKRTRVATWLSQGHAPTVALGMLCAKITRHVAAQGLEPLTLESVAAPPTPLALAEHRLRVAERREAAARAELESAHAEVAAAAAELANPGSGP